MTEYARDDFNRTVAVGSWGTADLGGAWSHDVTASTTVNVANPFGRGNFPTLAGRVDSRLAAATPALDVHAALRHAINANWGTVDQTVTVWIRSSGALASPVGYFARGTYRADRSVLLQLGYVAIAGTEVILRSVSWPAGTFATGIAWVIELEAWGTAPTHLRARAWRPAVAVPAASEGWITADDETGPQVAGVYQARLTRPASAVLSVMDVDWLYVTDPLVPAFTSSVTGLGVTVDSSSSQGDYTARSWDWGDGTAAGSGVTASHTYARYGTYRITLTATARSGATYTAYGLVTLASILPLPTDVLPQVVINGVDVCDSLYSVTWSLGRAHWAEGFAGLTASISLRGIFTAEQGQTVAISVPEYAGGAPLWVGIVDQVTETVELAEARDDTLVIAMDTASQLARNHLPYGVILAANQLPARLNDLAPAGVRYRYRYSAAVTSGRWAQLKKLTQAANGLRDRTYLELVTDALEASIAFGYTARDGAISYAPWEAPETLASTPRIDLNTGADCASRVTLQRDDLDGLINRWTVGGGADYDVPVRSSIERYGERAYNVPSPALISDDVFPFQVTRWSAMQTELAKPSRAVEAEVPVVAWGQKVISCNPLDFATWNGKLYSITGIRHEATVGQAWRVTLNLDRNPWEMDGRPVP